ncbi:MAG: Oligopeptide transport system permease protein [uncultured Sulfurovum sp.]|uniref:Oligopeptide transport system permease protein n=1 Tax=uncultured Sulfurovum sp. TaxID=269237 RepID=A0A6S6SIA8_9BACT|nr:MAG: Oligopeptide transport system permease protein [uncultured Sulfurovum sp.]
MTLTFLWTDIMVWILVVALIAWGFVISRSPQVQKQWTAIFKSSVAMISAMVLLVYLLFALLDSVHFYKEKSTQIVSLLDMAFEHRITEVERTYSSPFATVEYTKSIVSEDGVTKQINLPLKYVNETSIFNATAYAFLVGMMISIVLVSLHVIWRKRKGVKDVIAWNAAYVTLTVIVIVFTWLYLLSFDYHVLGTDKVGGDVLYQSLKSIRTGVLIGVLTTLVTLPLAIFLGVSAGLFRGWIDDLIQYIYTTLSSIPGVLLIAAAVLLTQVLMDNNPQWFETTEERSDLRLLFLVLILGITSWTGLCRLLRAETLKISQVEFVTAAKAFGVSKFSIIRKHIIPNLMHIILIAVVLDFSGLVLAEAVLSYVGVGVDPSMHSWGNMINQARLEMAREPMVWWSLFSAFVFMFVLVLAANLFSDRIQTVLDPRNNV